MKNQNTKNTKKPIRANGIDYPKTVAPVKKKMEDKLIDQVRETPFERVIKFLKYMKSLLLSFKVDKKVITELEWVLNTIKSNNLYSFNVEEKANQMDEHTKDTNEYVLGFLANYSNSANNNENKRRNSVLANIKGERRNSFLLIDTKSSIGSQKETLKNSHIMKTQELEAINKLREFANKINEENKINSIKMNETIVDRDALSNAFEAGISEDVDIEVKVDSTDLNIFDITEKVGRKRVLHSVYLEVLNRLDVKDLVVIDYKKLNCFTSEIRDGYNVNVLYHNDLHATDLCQTLYSWINKAGIAEVFLLSKLDLLSPRPLL